MASSCELEISSIHLKLDEVRDNAVSFADVQKLQVLINLLDFESQFFGAPVEL